MKLAFNRPTDHAANVVTLHRREHDDRDNHHDDRCSGQNPLVLMERTRLRQERDELRCHEVLRREQEDLREEKVVPNPHELEDRDRSERGERHREHNLVENSEVRSPIDPRRLFHFQGEGLKEVSHEQEDPRERPCRVDENDAKERVPESRIDHRDENGNRDHLLGDRHEQDDRKKEINSHGKSESGKPVGSQRCDENREEGRRNRDDEGVAQSAPHRGRRIGKGRLEVLQRRIEGIRDPPAVQNLSDGPDRSHENSEEWEEPEQADPPGNRMDYDRPYRDLGYSEPTSSVGHHALSTLPNGFARAQRRLMALWRRPAFLPFPMMIRLNIPAETTSVSPVRSVATTAASLKLPAMNA